jgi:hypothetical protein
MIEMEIVERLYIGCTKLVQFRLLSEAVTPLLAMKTPFRNWK